MSDPILDGLRAQGILAEAKVTTRKIDDLPPVYAVALDGTQIGTLTKDKRVGMPLLWRFTVAQDFPAYPAHLDAYSNTRQGALNRLVAHVQRHLAEGEGPRGSFKVGLGTTGKAQSPDAASMVGTTHRDAYAAGDTKGGDPNTKKSKLQRLLGAPYPMVVSQDNEGVDEGTAGLRLTKITEHGKTFTTGTPVTFTFLRNTAPTPNMGSRFGQDIEPAGRYMTHKNPSGIAPTPQWKIGTVTFRKPLVLAHGSTTGRAHGWKARLSHEYGGKTGLALSRAITADGYDGIVTVKSYKGERSTSEIVDLTKIAESVDEGYDLRKYATGLDLTDSEDRTIFRSKVAHALRLAKLTALREAGATARDRDTALKQLANAYIAQVTEGIDEGTDLAALKKQIKDTLPGGVVRDYVLLIATAKFAKSDAAKDRADAQAVRTLNVMTAQAQRAVMTALAKFPQLDEGIDKRKNAAQQVGGVVTFGEPATWKPGWNAEQDKRSKRGKPGHTDVVFSEVDTVGIDEALKLDRHGYLVKKGKKLQIVLRSTEGRVSTTTERDFLGGNARQDQSLAAVKKLANGLYKITGGWAYAPDPDDPDDNIESVYVSPHGIKKLDAQTEADRLAKLLTKKVKQWKTSMPGATGQIGKQRFIQGGAKATRRTTQAMLRWLKEQTGTTPPKADESTDEDFASTYQTKNRWVTVTHADLKRDPDLVVELFAMLAKSYAAIGGHANIKTPKDFLGGELEIIHAVDVDGDPEADAFKFYKTKPAGLKSAGGGSDGSASGKKAYVAKTVKDLQTRGVYAELSGAIAHILLTRFTVPVLTTQAAVEKALKKKVEWVGAHPDGKYPNAPGWYRRKLGGKMHLKILLGQPKGVTEDLDEGRTYTFNVATTRPAKARAHAIRVFGTDAKLDATLPNFDTNYALIQKKIKRAKDIPRIKMPVIEPDDMALFNKRLKAGRIDIFKPHAKGRLVGQQTMTKAQGKEWVTLGVKDGNKTDDIIRARWTSIAAKDLLPLQSEIWLEKLVGSIARFGLPKPGASLLNKTVIVSKEGYILDGHHRFGQAMLADPNIKLKALHIPLDINTLLQIGRAYGAAIGNKPKESIEEAETLPTGWKRTRGYPAFYEKGRGKNGLGVSESGTPQKTTWTAFTPKSDFGLHDAKGRVRRFTTKEQAMAAAEKAHAAEKNESLHEAKKLDGLAKFWPAMHTRQKGVFLHGKTKGKGTGIAALGNGQYFTWEVGAAEFFAGTTGTVQRYTLPKTLKLLDDRSKVFVDIKKKLGFQAWEYAAGPMFGAAIRVGVLAAGNYDGVISDNPAMGIVLFDPKKAKLLKESLDEVTDDQRKRAVVAKQSWNTDSKAGRESRLWSFKHSNLAASPGLRKFNIRNHLKLAWDELPEYVREWLRDHTRLPTDEATATADPAASFLADLKALPSIKSPSLRRKAEARVRRYYGTRTPQDRSDLDRIAKAFGLDLAPLKEGVDEGSFALGYSPGHVGRDEFLRDPFLALYGDPATGTVGTFSKASGHTTQARSHTSGPVPGAPGKSYQGEDLDEAKKKFTPAQRKALKYLGALHAKMKKLTKSGKPVQLPLDIINKNMNSRVWSNLYDRGYMTSPDRFVTGVSHVIDRRSHITGDSLLKQIDHVQWWVSLTPDGLAAVEGLNEASSAGTGTTGSGMRDPDLIHHTDASDADQYPQPAPDGTYTVPTKLWPLLIMKEGKALTRTGELVPVRQADGSHGQSVKAAQFFKLREDVYEVEFMGEPRILTHVGIDALWNAQDPTFHPDKLAWFQSTATPILEVDTTMGTTDPMGSTAQAVVGLAGVVNTCGHDGVCYYEPATQKATLRFPATSRTALQPTKAELIRQLTRVPGVKAGAVTFSGDADNTPIPRGHQGGPVDMGYRQRTRRTPPILPTTGQSDMPVRLGGWVAGYDEALGYEIVPNLDEGYKIGIPGSILRQDIRLDFDDKTQRDAAYKALEAAMQKSHKVLVSKKLKWSAGDKHYLELSFVVPGVPEKEIERRLKIIFQKAGVAESITEAMQVVRHDQDTPSQLVTLTFDSAKEGKAARAAFQDAAIKSNLRFMVPKDWVTDRGKSFAVRINLPRLSKSEVERRLGMILKKAGLTESDYVAEYQGFVPNAVSQAQGEAHAKKINGIIQRGSAKEIMAWWTTGRGLPTNEDALDEAALPVVMQSYAKKAQFQLLNLGKHGRFQAYSIRDLTPNSEALLTQRHGDKLPAFLKKVHTVANYNKGRTGAKTFVSDPMVDDFDIPFFLKRISKAMEKLHLPKTPGIVLFRAGSASGWVYPHEAQLHGGLTPIRINRAPSDTATSKYKEWKGPRSPHTLVHEYAHQVWFVSMSKKQRDEATAYFNTHVKADKQAALANKTAPTPYSTTKASEWWAEVVGYSMHPGRLNPQVVDFIKQLMAGTTAESAEPIPFEDGCDEYLSEGDAWGDEVDSVGTLDEATVTADDLKQYLVPRKSVIMGGAWWTVVARSLKTGKIAFTKATWEKGKKGGVRYTTFDTVLKNVNSGKWGMSILNKGHIGADSPRFGAKEKRKAEKEKAEKKAKKESLDWDGITAYIGEGLEVAEPAILHAILPPCSEAVLDAHFDALDRVTTGWGGASPRPDGAWDWWTEADDDEIDAIQATVEAVGGVNLTPPAPIPVYILDEAIHRDVPFAPDGPEATLYTELVRALRRGELNGTRESAEAYIRSQRESVETTGPQYRADAPVLDKLVREGVLRPAIPQSNDDTHGAAGPGDAPAGSTSMGGQGGYATNARQDQQPA